MPFNGESQSGGPIRAILAHWRALYIIVAILTIAGLYAVTKLPEQVYPTLQFSRVLVLAQNGDLAPPLVQSSMTRPLEQQLAAVLGVQQIVANSTQGASSISITFDAKSTSINVALQRVSAAVSTVQAQLPQGTELTIQQVDPNLFPVLGYALSSPRLSQTDLRDTALYQMRPRLLGLPGVSFVTVLGGDVREYLVSVDPRQLAAHNVTVNELTAAIAQTNTVRSVGHTDNNYVRSTILAMGQAHSAQDIANIPIATRGATPLTVGNVAGVVQASAPPQWDTRSNGRQSVIISVFAQPGASFVGVAKTVADQMRILASQLPDVQVAKFWDQAVLVSDAIGSLRDAILIGLGLSTLVLFFFLRNWASTLVAALVIPLSIIIAFALMAPMGQGLNLMTLGGLAIGVGLIIDDAIVVVENVYRHLTQGEDRRTAIVTAVSEIASPMISSTITTIVVFAPLTLLSGVAGAFFKALAATLAVALALSLILALIVTPNVASQFLKVTSERKNAALEWVEQRYEPLLKNALRRRKLVLGIAAAILVVTILLATQLGTDFMPSLDEGAFELGFRLPPGATLTETKQAERQIEEIVSSDPAIASTATLVGLTYTNVDTPAGVNTGSLRATLKPKWQRSPILQVIARLQNKIHEQVPIAQISTKQLLQDMLNDLSNAPAPIEIRVIGPQQSVLVPIATDIASRLTGIPGVSGAFSGAVYHNPSLVLSAAPGSGTLGVTPAQLQEDEAVAFGGDVISSVLQNPLTIPVRVRYNLPLDPTMAMVENVPIVTSNGGVQPLSRLATFAQGPPQSEINELNGQQYLAVTAQLSGSNLGAVVSAIKRAIASVHLPAGYAVQIAGAYALQNRSFAQFAFAIALSVALVFLVMLIQFKSFLQPVAIIATIPLALFGAVLALFLTHISLNVSSMMGLILLVGLVVKNGILLLEYAHRRETNGETVQDALIHASRVRLRPILMTTLTALLGMIPLAFAIGSGSELLQPLAIAVIGGLLFSTIFTLVIIPTVYDALHHATRRGAVPTNETSTLETAHA